MIYEPVPLMEQSKLDILSSLLNVPVNKVVVRKVTKRDRQLIRTGYIQYVDYGLCVRASRRTAVSVIVDYQGQSAK